MAWPGSSKMLKISWSHEESWTLVALGHVLGGSRATPRTVANAAEAAKEKRKGAKDARVELAQRKVRMRKEALRKALGSEPSDAMGPALLREQLPSPEVIEKLSAYEALAEALASASCSHFQP